jgi:AcrR family transcriptional regulator
VARPLSQERRTAILSTATRVIAAEGTAASTARIAKLAGVSNGSLFVYFPTKAELLNTLFVDLKTEMGTTATTELDAEAEPREQVRHMWTQWMSWATGAPEKRGALAQLEVDDHITAESRAAVSTAFEGVADLLERARADGPTSDAPLAFVLTLISAIAEAAIDTILTDPAEAEPLSHVAFEAVWRVLSGSAP